MLFDHFCPPCQEIFEKWMINRLIDFCKVAVSVNISNEEVVSCGIQFESFAQPLQHSTIPKAAETSHGMNSELRNGCNPRETIHCKETNKTQSNSVNSTRVSTNKDWEMRFWANFSKDANIDFNCVDDSTGSSSVNGENRANLIQNPILSTPTALEFRPEQNSSDVVSKDADELPLPTIPSNEKISEQLPNDKRNCNLNDDSHLTENFESLNMENPTLDQTSSNRAFGNWQHPIFNSVTAEIVDPKIVKKTIEQNFIKDKVKSSLFHCTYNHKCRRTYVNLSNIRNHIFGLFYYAPCPNCGKPFRHYNNMDTHFKKCTEKDPKSNDSKSRCKRSIPEGKKFEEKEKKRKTVTILDENKNSIKIKPRCNILRIPDFMINSDEPATELDQIYSSFTRSAVRRNRDYCCIPKKKPNYIKPSPASKKLLRTTESIE